MKRLHRYDRQLQMEAVNEISRLPHELRQLDPCLQKNSENHPCDGTLNKAP